MRLYSPFFFLLIIGIAFAEDKKCDKSECWKKCTTKDPQSRGYCRPKIGCVCFGVCNRDDCNKECEKSDPKSKGECRSSGSRSETGLRRCMCFAKNYKKQMPK